MSTCSKNLLHFFTEFSATAVGTASLYCGMYGGKAAESGTVTATHTPEVNKKEKTYTL